MPNTVANTPPKYPIKLTKPLAPLLSGFGVTSGIKATAGDLYDCIITKNNNIKTITPGNIFHMHIKAIKGKTNIVINIPITIYGILLPNLVLVLSDSLPKIGIINMAATLSSAIIIPTI